MKAITREEKIMSGENLTPITRKEMFLAKASGQNIQTPTPITREEYFLSKITGGGGTSNKPTAYTVSSVDELPTNAVDGSMAIVESDSEWVGVWEFKGELTRSDDIWGNAESGYSEFSLRAKMQDGFEVRKMRFAETYDGIYTLQYFGEMEHQNLDVYRTDELWGMPKGWLDESYKTLTLLTELDEGVAMWWKSNAIRTVAHKLKTFYIRENGEWVYKCEVV